MKEDCAARGYKKGKEIKDWKEADIIPGLN